MLSFQRIIRILEYGVLNKMVAICRHFQMHFPEKNVLVFLLKFHWCLLNLQIVITGSGYSLGTNRRQSITWIGTTSNLWRHMALPGDFELIHHRLVYWSVDTHFKLDDFVQFKFLGIFGYFQNIFEAFKRGRSRVVATITFGVFNDPKDVTIFQFCYNQW